MLVLVKEYGDLIQDGSSRDGAKCMELECILEIDPTGLDDELMTWMWVIISRYKDRSCVCVCVYFECWMYSVAI